MQVLLFLNEKRRYFREENRNSSFAFTYSFKNNSKRFFLCLEILVLRKLGMMQYSCHFRCGEYVNTMQNMALLLFGEKSFGVRCEY